MRNSIKSIQELPSIPELLHFCKALAIMDLILIPEWGYRYFSFDSNWNIAEGEMMASMRNGNGGEYFILFSAAGVVGKVFAQDEAVAPSNFLDCIPNSFKNFKNELAFSLDNISYCFWREKIDNQWYFAPKLKSNFIFMEFLIEGIYYYHKWVESYLERDVNFGALINIYNSLIVTDKNLKELNSNIIISDVKGEIDEILG